MARAARNTSINPAQIQIVHVWNRCVRRAFLCGLDQYTGRNYEHRRNWARTRLEHLSSLFAIDCITYSIMTNHTHQILRSRPDVVAQWDDRTVAIRWLSITPAYDADGNPIEPKEAEINKIVNHPVRLAELRSRLSDISWWMRYFSHYIACRSNREDEVSGHFWESRFGSEVLESDASTVACMIYVDLNPIRAGLAATPEDSEYTGAKDRIDDLRISLGTTDLGDQLLTLDSSSHQIHDWERLDNPHSGWLSPIEIDEARDPIGPDAEDSGRRPSRKGVASMSVARYLQLLDWVGRTVRSDKRGSIPAELAPILERIGLNEQSLLSSMWRFGGPAGQYSTPVSAAIACDAGQQAPVGNPVPATIFRQPLPYEPTAKI